jgi:hypothetical protein
MKLNIIEDFNLPKYVKGKSFAEASKAIEKKFADRTDGASLKTKEELMQRLAKAQEYIKMQESLKANSQEVPDMMNGQVPEGFEQNQMFEGGFQDMEGADKAGAVIGDAGTALGFAQDAFGDTGVDTSGLAGRQAQEKGTGWDAAGAGLKGAAAGAKYGPIGAGVGAVIGVGSSLIGASRRKNDIHQSNMNASRIENNTYTNDFNEGGFLGKLFKKKSNQIDYEGIDSTFNDPNTFDPNKIDASVHGATKIKAQQSDASKFKAPIGKAVDWAKDNYGDILRTAPIVGNALQLKNLEKPSKVNLDRLDSRYKTNYVDERALENRVQNEHNNVSRGLAGASNGSLGALRSNLLGANLNKTTATSDAYLKADDLNRQEDRAAQQFNNRNDMMNLRQGTMEQQMNDQNEGAYNSAKSALQSQLATDIGNFGKEKVNMKQVAEMFGYKWDGEYFVDKNGKKIDPKSIANKEDKKNENK